ncbi:hypothetical protein HMPREF9080_01502 [Cardiobacterium valvarum F0432]|uniref:Uncharacterized protein n=1 Tax=Cardiobacterium valvarum F0432 TaxID=797473 RepID=G9ZFF7_9GAMM|nr:hypothetical protein HMPREF9080_01502 [Cardiobacterium valvarum F0432]
MPHEARTLSGNDAVSYRPTFSLLFPLFSGTWHHSRCRFCCIVFEKNATSTRGLA